MIPADIFNGEEWQLTPPAEALTISHSFSDEDDLLSFETPRLELELFDAEYPGEHDDEWLWFFISSDLRNAFALLFGGGLNAHEERSLDRTERNFYLKSTSSKGKV